MEEVCFSRVLNCESPESDKDNCRHRIIIGDLTGENYLIGWIDEKGFYIRSAEGKLVQVSLTQLLSIGDHIDLLRLARIEREMGKPEKTQSNNN